MNGNEFLARVRRYARRRRVAMELVTRKGKGSHARLIVGDNFTTLKDRKKEIGPGLLAKILRDLKIDPDDF